MYNRDKDYIYIFTFLWIIFLWASIVRIPCRVKKLPSYTEYLDYVY